MEHARENEAATGAPAPLQLNGQMYLVSPPTDQDMATLHTYLRKKLASPVEAIVGDLKGLTPHQQQMVIKAAVELKAGGGATLTPAFVQEQLYEPEGCAFLAWLLIRKNHRDVTLESLREVITADNVVDVLAGLAEASGMDTVMPGKSEWPDWLVQWGLTDRPKLYRDMIERSDFKLTPLDCATLPIPQLLLVFRPKEQFASSHANVLKLINERRASQGLPPIQERKRKAERDGR